MDKYPYKKLAVHLDRLPGGFPATDSGVEIKILQKLFTPHEAALACHLTLIPEGVSVVALRSGLPIEETGTRLEEMAAKGLIMRRSTNGRITYQAAQFVVGIWEFQVGNLDRELVTLMEAYLPAFFNADVWRAAPQMRTIPVDRSIDNRLAILDHERAKQLVAGKKNFVITPCICRQERRLVDQGCDKPLEACISFGSADAYFRRMGIGRKASREEVLEILEQADRHGLVLQSSNSKESAWICCCCGCCCGVLRALKQAPRPADICAAPFRAAFDPKSCLGTKCGLCRQRCQMDAFESGDDGGVSYLSYRCIGCGLCVSTCPKKALTLERKPAKQQPAVPRNIALTLLRLAWKRGQLGPVGLAKMVFDSQVDRLKARNAKVDISGVS